MSFDIFIASYRDGQPRSFKRSVFEDIFGQFVSERGKHFLRLQYPGRGGADVYIDDTEDIGIVMFNHCGGEAFWDGVFQLAERIQGVVWWPNVEHISTVTSKDVLRHLPAKFTDDEAHPTVVSSGRDIVDAIGRS